MKTLSTGDGPAVRARPDRDELAPGERVASYRVVRLIGRGGMGEVYAAEDTRLGRAVALKRIASHRRDDGAARARFWREARGLAAVKHEGLVAVYEIGEDPRSGLFIAMELVDGAPLSALVADGARLLPATAVGLVAQAAEALGAAHAAGLVHRDIKPGNLLLERSGRVRVVDFGLARRVDDLEQLTRDGAVLGTPAYMAPEQVDGREVGPAADVFALGLVLYRALAGFHPFARETPQATALAIAGSLRRSLAEACPELPAALVAVVDRALAVAPEERFAEAGALAEALRALEPVLGRDPGLAGVLAGEAWPVPVALVPSASAPDDRRTWRPWGWAALVGAAGLAVAGWVMGSGSAGEVPSVSPSSVGAVAVAAGQLEAQGAHEVGRAIAALPPRPAVVVLGFEAEETAAADAAVAAEVVRTRLAEHEGQVDSVPLEVAREMVGALSPALPPTIFARPERRAGHVDLVVRGAWRAEALEVELVETATARVLARWEEELTADAVAVAERLSASIEGRLGIVRRGRATLSQVPAAWTALMAARRAGRGADLGGARRHLEWALRADPGFALVQVEELSILRMENRVEDLLRLSGELLATPERLTPQALGYTEAMRLWAEHRSDEAMRALDRLLERFPFEVDPALPLMALRAKDPLVRDPAEVERIARRMLALAPRQETSASRYVRALGIQGRIAEVERFLLELGLERTDEELAQIWAEVDLFAGRYEQAERGFVKVLEDEPGNVYYEHLAITAALLAGRCEEAAARALDRITRLEAMRRESMLDWTYSLAAQATICAEAFEGLPGILAGWRAHNPARAAEVDELEARVAVLRGQLAGGDALDAFGAAWPELLVEGDADTELSAAGLYLRFGEDEEALALIERRARRRALDRSVSVPGRGAWRTVAQGAAAKLALLQRLPPDAVIARFDAAVPERARIAGEDEARWYVEALVWRAQALDALGDARALSAWAEVRDLGFHRLWFSELWVLAGRRAGR